MNILKNKVALVVDDDPLLLEAMAFEIELTGAKILTAANGEQGLELVKNNPVEIVITDVRMPKGDGKFLLTEIRRINPITPIVILVTGNMDLSQEEAYALGASAVIHKPFASENFIERINTALENTPFAFKKRFERFNCDFDIRLFFTSLSEAFNAKALNIGRGGIFIGLEKNLPQVGKQIDFEIDFNDEQTCVRGTGIVRWARNKDLGQLKSGVGIEVMAIDGNDFELWNECIENLKNSPVYLPKG